MSEVPLYAPLSPTESVSEQGQRERVDILFFFFFFFFFTTLDLELSDTQVYEPYTSSS